MEGKPVWRELKVTNKPEDGSNELILRTIAEPGISRHDYYAKLEQSARQVAQWRSEEIEMVGYDHGQCEYTAFTYDPTKLADFAKWRTACKDKKWADPPIEPSELKWLVRDNIFTEDEGTEKAIDAAIAKVTAGGKGDPAAMHTFRRTSTGDELAALPAHCGNVPR
jgi:hypothetical protein